MLTSFRGFFQFGVMGAAGVLFCWLATFTVLPALLMVGDRRALGERARQAPLSLAPLARLMARRPAGASLVASLAVTVLRRPGLLHFTAAPFEYDFRRLNARLRGDRDRARVRGQPERPVRALAPAHHHAGRRA